MKNTGKKRTRRDLENDAFQSGAFKIVFNPGKSLHFIVRAAGKMQRRDACTLHEAGTMEK